MTAQQSTILGSVRSRDRLVVLGGIAGLAALAWAYLIRAAGEAGGVAGAAMPPEQAWSPVELSVVLLMWVVMMIAMMVPSATPLILMFATIGRQRRRAEQAFVPVSGFVLGYVVVWAGAAVLATAAQWGLHETGALSPRMDSIAPVLGGTVLVAAGTYQWTPLKRACLRHCRSPLGFLMTEWRSGRLGALVMGIRHGGFCLGCCWALMSLMFVGGTMSLLWMAGIAIYVLLEKVVPDGHRLGRIAGLLLVLWGLLTLAQSW